MLEQTKRISFGISSVLYKVEPEQDLYTGSGQKVPASTPQQCLKSNTTKIFFFVQSDSGEKVPYTSAEKIRGRRNNVTNKKNYKTRERKNL